MGLMALIAALSQATPLYLKPSRRNGSWNEDNCTCLVQANTFNPCFCTTTNSLSAMPLGRFAPASHF